MLVPMLYILLAAANPTQKIAKVSASTCIKHRATYYEPGLEGKPMANRKPYNSHEYSAAFNKWPLGSLLKVTNMNDHTSILVRVTDRKKTGWSIDLSRAAYNALGFSTKLGWGWVCLELVKEK